MAATKRVNDAQCTSWYHAREESRQKLVSTMRTTFESLLAAQRIPYVYVSGRTKTLKSLLKKIQKKKYTNLDAQVTDLAGLRIVLYTEADVLKACEVVKSALTIHPDKSGNKSDQLGTDRFGYRSVHYVCEIGPTRVALPEFAVYQGVLFEVQVRTILQHAWAEIEHDRSYKADQLPDALRRRLALVAGLLESADRELDSIARDADAHIEAVRQLGQKLGEDNIQQLVEAHAKKAGIKLADLFDFGPTPYTKTVLEELRSFGVHDRPSFDALFDQEFWSLYRKAPQSGNTWVGLARDGMMIRDLPRYLDIVGREWDEIDEGTFGLAVAKYGDANATRAFKDHGIRIGLSFEDYDESSPEDYPMGPDDYAPDLDGYVPPDPDDFGDYAPD
ncbi:MAG: hypothetical protein KF850_28500 [Labilithrix sp.]|nr:hypothetical protein [Labilithrix sp.]